MPGINDRRNRATKTSHERRLLWNDFATRRNLPGDVGANARGPLGPVDDHNHTDWKREVSMRKTERGPSSGPWGRRMDSRPLVDAGSFFVAVLWVSGIRTTSRSLRTCSRTKQ